MYACKKNDKYEVCMISACPHVYWSKFQSATILTGQLFNFVSFPNQMHYLELAGRLLIAIWDKGIRKDGYSLRHPVRHRPPKSHQHYNIPEKTKVKIKHKIITKTRVKWWEWPKEKKKVMILSQQPLDKGDDKEGQNNYKVTKTHMRMIRMTGKKNV